MKINSVFKKDIYILICVQLIFWITRIIYLFNTDHAFHGDAASKLNISFQQFNHFYHWPVHFWLPLPFDIIHIASMITREWVITTRVVPSIFLSISICFGYFYLKAQFSKIVAIINSLIISIAAPILVVSTAYLAETYSISFMLISLYFYQNSKDKIFHTFLFGIFISAGMLTRYEMFIFGFIFILGKVYKNRRKFEHLFVMGSIIIPTTIYIFYMNFKFSGNFLHGFFAHTRLMEILNLNFPNQLEDLVVFKFGLPLGFLSLLIGTYGLYTRLINKIKTKEDIALELFTILYSFILINNILTDNLVIDFRFTIMLGIFLSIYSIDFLHKIKSKKVFFLPLSLLLILELGINTNYFRNNIHFNFDSGLKDTALFVKNSLDPNTSLYIDRVQEHGVRMWHTEAWFPLANRSTNNYHPKNSVKCVVENNPVEIDTEQTLLENHLKCLKNFKPKVIVTFKDGFLDRLIKREDQSFENYSLKEIFSSNGYKVFKVFENEKN